MHYGDLILILLLAALSGYALYACIRRGGCADCGKCSARSCCPASKPGSCGQHKHACHCQPEHTCGCGKGKSCRCGTEKQD